MPKQTWSTVEAAIAVESCVWETPLTFQLVSIGLALASICSSITFHVLAVIEEPPVVPGNPAEVMYIAR